MKPNYTILLYVLTSVSCRGPQTIAAAFVSKFTSKSCIQQKPPIPLFGYLDEINKVDPVESESMDSAELFDLYISKAEAAFSRAQQKMGAMKLNEKQSQQAVQEVQERMKQQEADLTNRLEDEVKNVKMEAERERNEVIERYRSREMLLEEESNKLIHQLEMEKKNMEANRIIIQETEAKRVALDQQVALLQQKFNAESENLSAKFMAEQEKQKAEIADAQEKVQELQVSARMLSEQSEKRILALQEQLSWKEQEKEEAILLIQKEMDAREVQLTNELEAIKALYQDREVMLRDETETLKRHLEQEKEKILANQAMTANLVSQRVALDTELGELRRLYETESKQWDSKYAREQDTRRLELTKAQNEILEMQTKAELAMAELEKSKMKLSEQLSVKETQMQAVIVALKDQLQAKQKEFKEITNELGAQITKTKIDANLRDISLAEAARAREIRLQTEKEDLVKMVESERKSLKINQDLTNRILKQRVEIDAELGELKRRFDQDSKRWDAKYTKQQEKRRLEIMRSKRQLQQLHEAAESALQDAWERQERLTAQLAVKEREKEETFIALREEMKVKEKKYKDAIADLGMQITRLKIDANEREVRLRSEAKSREQSLMSAAQAREEELLKEICELRQSLKMS